MHCPTGIRGILHLLRTDEMVLGLRSWVVARGPSCLTLRLRHKQEPPLSGCRGRSSSSSAGKELWTQNSVSAPWGSWVPRMILEMGVPSAFCLLLTLLCEGQAPPVSQLGCAILHPSQAYNCPLSLRLAEYHRKGSSYLSPPSACRTLSGRIGTTSIHHPVHAFKKQDTQEAKLV